jgi:uncharacterized repeat protein (TIGR01451 family)
VHFRHVMSALLLALSTASCSLGDSVDAGSINVFVAVDDAQLTVGEETITFTVTARNVGYDPLTLTGPSDCLLYVEIFNTQGTMVWSSVQGSCQGATVTEEIAAGQSKDQSFPWNGVNVAGAYLAPGLYLVRGVARTPGTSSVGPALTVALD